MESKLKTIVNGALKYPILLIASGVVALFCLIQFFIQLGSFFNSIGWFFESVLWYFSRGNFLGGVGSIFGGMFDLLDTFWYALQFLAVIALLGMFIMYITGTLKMTKGSGIILLIAAIVASYIIRPLYEIVNGLPMFGGAASFLMRLRFILPMNLAALVAVVFLFIYLKKKKPMSFTLYLLIAGGIQILLALFHIVGLFIAAGAGAIHFNNITAWIIHLVSPVVFVLLGCMMEKQITGKPVPYIQKIVDAINGIQFTKPPAAPVNTPAAPAVPVQPAPQQAAPAAAVQTPEPAPEVVVQPETAAPSVESDAKPAEE
ncbi:MAG: hypothetical protein ACOX6U_08045 [Oscillospiraceae bacterium]|jgi:hypothetical protein